jgi:tight adherence protein C
VSTAVWGALLGGVAGVGLLLVGLRVAVLRRPQLSVRVLPYLRDVPRLDETALLRPVATAPTSAAAGIFGPLLRQAADLVERVLGGSTSVRRRLQRAGLDGTVQDFRIEQVVWGLVGFAAAAAVVLLRALGGVGSIGSGVVFCLLGFVCGVFLRDNRLSTQVKNRERQVLVEFPTVAELLALSVAAGESPVSALDRVVRRSNGALSDDLAQVLARIRTGEPVGSAFESLARSTGLPIVARFATGITVAMERGTPLADVLHAQAADVREAGRRLLIETAARKEIAMMAPVVFFVLPVTILFAFYPGVLGLRLTTP